MVAKMKHLSEEMGREVATSEEARKILGLKGQVHQIRHTEEYRRG
jgi:uncharacterized protein (DUF849 family)